MTLFRGLNMGLIQMTLFLIIAMQFVSLYFNYDWHYVKKHRLTMQVQKLSTLAHNIRVVTYPGACDAATIAIIGEACDVGNYMEAAGTDLEFQSDALLQNLAN